MAEWNEVAILANVYAARRKHGMCCHLWSI